MAYEAVAYLTLEGENGTRSTTLTRCTAVKPTDAFASFWANLGIGRFCARSAVLPYAPLVSLAAPPLLVQWAADASTDRWSSCFSAAQQAAEIPSVAVEKSVERRSSRFSSQAGELAAPAALVQQTAIPPPSTVRRGSVSPAG
ncbi:hypothetical protein HPB48_017739 [Haemaphysalis longicornis]|uniref:Uncharacterized protein n=1 Tax=Haemaphysalis longicornis TaxID=44386 RepID=A0A9J6G4L1_HAELO|nr:hypothetical protein HPB48_017739 [Haemaphysalis longicornis]